MFKRKGEQVPDHSGWQRVPAEVVSVEYGLVRNANYGIGSFEKLSAPADVRLTLFPAAGPPYSATLKLGRNESGVPNAAGTRLEVLVDPADAQRLALPPDPVFTLVGGQEWKPTQGIAGALAEAAQRNDVAEIARLTAQLSSQPAAATTEPTPDSATSTTLEQLQQLGKLGDSGVRTPDDFETQKARIPNQQS